jgi:hypothetical protein
MTQALGYERTESSRRAVTWAAKAVQLGLREKDVAAPPRP